jgi:hypothetical protein
LLYFGCRKQLLQRHNVNQLNEKPHQARGHAVDQFRVATKGWHSLQERLHEGSARLSLDFGDAGSQPVAQHGACELAHSSVLRLQQVVGYEYDAWLILQCLKIQVGLLDVLR